LLSINKLSGVPVYEQIIEQFQKLIITGIIKPGEQIPSVRSLSMELTVNPNTIQKAYNELEILGITSSVPGVGRFVSKDAKALLQRSYSEKLTGLRDTITNLAIAGVDEGKIITLVKNIYGNEKNDKEKRNKS